MRSGRMIPVAVERPAETRDATYNHATITWVVELETRATKRLLSSRERYADEQHISTADVEWRFRYRTPFDPRWRIRELRTGELHRIQGQPTDPDGRRREVVVRTTSFVPDASTDAEV